MPVNQPFVAQGHPVSARLFQAAMWRDYAAAWGRSNSPRRVGREWMVSMRMPVKAECVRRSRAALANG